MATSKQGKTTSSPKVATVREMQAARQRAEQSAVLEERVRRALNVCDIKAERLRLTQELNAVRALLAESIAQYQELASRMEGADK